MEQANAERATGRTVTADRKPASIETNGQLANEADLLTLNTPMMCLDETGQPRVALLGSCCLPHP